MNKSITLYITFICASFALVHNFRTRGIIEGARASSMLVPAFLAYIVG